ncbi:MAG: hypothetical protein GF393_02265, partial [Armatimonadia bacterium]|nr:hypothetical protein [Armatimonadia bacterium]
MTTRTLIAIIATMALTGACFAQDAAENLLANPGFEADGNWGMRPPELISYDDTVARSGERSLKISDPAGQSNPWAPQAVTGLKGGATYTFSAWYRTTEEGPAANRAAALKIEFYNEDGQNTKGQYARSSEATNGEWTLISRTSVAPPDTTRASVLVRLFAQGTVWFDDCAFVQTEPAPVVALAPERLAPEAEAEEFTLTARLAEPWDETEPPINIRVFEADDGEIPSQTTLERVDASTFEATVQMAEALASGSYRVEATLGQTPGGMSWLHVPMADRKPENLTDTGTILVDGEPFFPIGVYHCSPAHYPMLAEAGFNCVQGKGPRNLERFGESLDAAAENGIMVDVPLYADGQVLANMSESLAGIEAYADHPAVMCWKIIDEPDIREDIVDEVARAYVQLKAADRVRPIELTLCQPPGFGYWADFCDIMQVDPYPLPANPLTMVSDWLDTAKAGLEPWQNLTAVLQSGWKHNPFNQPTPEQARSQVYLALIHGAKGIFWYSFRDPGWRLEETPLWDAFPAINAELKTLSMPVMVGESDERVSVTSPDEVVHWRAWEHEGQTWLLMTNPFEEPVTATVDPGGECRVCDMHGEGLE